MNDKHLALIGGGPAALFILKHIITAGVCVDAITIIERNGRLGVGMPYGDAGAHTAHLTNVAAIELPALYQSFESFLSAGSYTEHPDFPVGARFNKYQVIPRLLLGQYLESQFQEYILLARSRGIKVDVLTNHTVTDIIPVAEGRYNIVVENGNTPIRVSTVVLCTGHVWPAAHEKDVPGYYDSPYPPMKFNRPMNCRVAVRGTSLTAVDAIKTLARLNGKFSTAQNGTMTYKKNDDCKHFAIDLFSTRGFLPALRFHTEDESFSAHWLMTEEEIAAYKVEHGGFVALDYVFDRYFKSVLRKKDPAFYHLIKDWSIESFADRMLEMRKQNDCFTVFRWEYEEARESIVAQKTIAWKEALSTFSYCMGYVAKHFSAEDMLRFRKTLNPLISIIIAALPQSSYHEIMALHEAGVLTCTALGRDSRVEPGKEGGATIVCHDSQQRKQQMEYRVFIDAIGQKAMDYNDFPFQGLSRSGCISRAFLSFSDPYVAAQRFRDGHSDMAAADSEKEYRLQVKGLCINDRFQAVDTNGKALHNLYIMAVPFISGLHSDYSGLDFCDTAGSIVVSAIAQGMV